jgi:predicted enzyme related to lactoylglutathione lyase
MASTVQPVIVTADLNRLLAFYAGLFGATQTFRVPDDGPAFFVGLRVGDSDMGLVANAEGAAGAASRILLSVAVEDVDSMLERVNALGGSVRGQPNNMPWGQRVAHIADPDGNTVNLTQPV